MAARQERAEDLERHLIKENIGELGVTTERKGARVTLKHDRFYIVIDCDLDAYHIGKEPGDVMRRFNVHSLDALTEQFGEPMRLLKSFQGMGLKTKVRTVEQVDAVILNILQDALE